MRGSKNILNFFRGFIYRLKHKTNDFPIYGLDVFLGDFGSGKTMSCVNLITDVLEKFPNCRFVSNVDIKTLTNNKFLVTCEEEFLKVLLTVLSDNVDKGCIVLIDECDGFLLDTLVVGTYNYKVFFTILKQLRKLNCLIVLTSQLWNKIPKVLRDYIILNGRIIQCRKLFSGFTLYQYYDMKDITEDSKIRLVGKFKRSDYLIHTPELYECYDSKAVVTPIKGLLENEVFKNA